MDNFENDTNKSKKINSKVFSSRETILLVLIALIIGLSIGTLFKNGNPIKNINRVNNKYINKFIDNYEFITNNYYEEVDQEKLINSAIAGMMESLDDPYSMYFDEEEADNFSTQLNGSYKGLGIQILKDEKTGYMLVTTVFKNSPAFSAGLKPGDMIVSVDDTSVSSLTASEVSSLIKSSEDSTHILKIIRDDEQLEITLNKETVILTSVASDMYEENGKKIGYIYIGIFANNTYEQFKEELENLEKEKIDYLILDVRGNTGGHLTAVDSILDLFLNSSQIMYGFEQNGKISYTYGNGSDNKNYEIVLLADEASASASEVLIAGLKENLNSVLIGKKTYGKGTVQKLVTLSDGTQYKITVKKWLTPKGNWINSTEGITPDIEQELSDKYYETYDVKDDTQLNAALNYIKEK